MARLLGCERAEVQADRLGVARDAAMRWNQIVLLKGAHSVVAAPDGRIYVLPFANPLLATAGTGDVLAGAIVGLLAQGVAPLDAAIAGAFLHGMVADMLGKESGWRAGCVAGDLLPLLPSAIARLSA
jgi:ADP-dependent NAD(P)H-hydrate dehydratase / NAD(P)H-hydrate epimerase